MSFLMTGERIIWVDIFLILITFAGVTLVTIGFNLQSDNNNDDINAPTLAKIGAFAIPFLLSLGNITMRKMKGLHENTVSLYMNPCLAIVMGIYMYWVGLSAAPFFESQFKLLDWFLLIWFSVGTVLVQTLKFSALQYEEPGKLSHYQYFLSIYQLIYDMTLLGA